MTRPVIRRDALRRPALAGAAASLLLLASCGPQQSAMERLREWQRQAAAWTHEQMLESHTRLMEIQFEPREAGEFLLTPALLVQKVLEAEGVAAAPPAGVRFDATVEIRPFSRGPSSALFVRYWVTKSAYRAEVLWTEPAWGGGPEPFQYYMTRLTVRRNDTSLLVYSPFNAPHEEFRLPLGEHDWTKPLTPWRWGLLGELALLAADGHPLTPISCPREGPDGQPQPVRQTFTLPQRLVPMAGVTFLVQSGDGREPCRLAYYHFGGRRCVVEYRPVQLGGRQADLPVSFDVFRESDGRLLRRATLSNFARLDDARKVIDAPESLVGAPPTPEEESHRDLLWRNWMKEPSKVSAQDRAELARLESHFAARLAQPCAAWEKLKYLYILCNTATLLDNERALRERSRAYLETLQEAGGPEALLAAGPELIEHMVRWGKRDFAADIVARWATAAARANDPEEVLAFVGDRLRSRLGWLAYQLLAGLQDTGTHDAERRFRIEYWMCTSLRAVLDGLGARSATQPPSTACELTLASTSRTRAELEAMLARHLRSAAAEYKGLENPGKAVRDMKATLDLCKL